MRDAIEPRKYMRGDVRAHLVPSDRTFALTGLIPDDTPCDPFAYASAYASRYGRPPGWSPRTDFRHNDFLYEWGAIFANLLMRRGLNYGVGGMYVEFENVASPGDPVSAPDFTRSPDEGVGYYNDLALSPDRDYLRVPLIAATLDSSDAVSFPHGNLATFFAQTAGVTGVHGKAFSDSANSTVFGGALVAFVDDADHTRDLVLSRFYLETASQQPKLATGQVGFEWRLTLN